MQRLIKIFILSAILSVGFMLRSYNLNFPSIGYHNMKENEYLSMAQEMKASGDLLMRRIYFYDAFEEEPKMKLYPQPPLISYQILASWKVLGENIWGARLCNVLFAVISIVVMYYIALLLFRNTGLSLFCAFLLAIMPLAVFFSRNLQPESPAFFFMLLGNLFYLRYVSSLKKYHLLLGGFSFSIAWLYKFSFLIGALPFLFCFPVKSIFKNKKETFRNFLAVFLPFLVIIFSIVWLKRAGLWLWDVQVLRRIQLFELFTPDYWEKYGRTIWWYTRQENFTLLYTLLALSGIGLAFFKRRGLLNRYIMGWAAAAIFYCMIFSDFINQHNYYQMPFLALVCISVVYAISYISEIVIIKNIPKEYFLLFLVVGVTAVSAPFVYDASARMYGTVFLGLDVAGDSLREFTGSKERIFLLTHAQGKGIARYARRFTGWEDTLESFQDKEKRFNIRYACFYPAEFALSLKVNNPALFEYIQNNYHVKEVGLTEEPSQLYYLILEKGKGSEAETFLQSFSGARALKNIYKLFGKHVFFYTLRPPPE